jgi:VanZ family protein
MIESVHDGSGSQNLTQEPNTARAAWTTATAAWIALILFSSTSIAADSCERAFAWLYGSTLGHRLPSDSAYDVSHFIAEKGLHLTLFFVLGLLLWRLATATPGRRVALIVLMGLVVGSASELLQAFFPGRDPAIRDVLINGTGTLLAAAACAYKSAQQAGDRSAQG